MKLLVTGGAGFIGSNFIHYWLKEHSRDSIVNLDKLSYSGNWENLKEFIKDSRLEGKKAGDEFDITCTFPTGSTCKIGELGGFDRKRFAKLIEKINSVDVVVHFAAESHVDRSVLEANPDRPIAGDFVLNNVWGTHIMLEAAVKAWKGSMVGKRFHHVSTDEVFGALNLEDTKKFDEETKYEPRSPYAASKASSDLLVRAYHTSFDLPITISNTSNNYGPYMYPEKLLPLAITNLLQDKKVPVYGDGKYVRDWLYVEDHCRGIDLILNKGKVGETYCLGGLWDDVNNLELIKRVLKIMGKDESSIEFVKDRPGHDRRYAINFNKAKRELGYEPKCDLDTYLKIMIGWYQNNRWWWEPIKSGAYYKEYYRQQYELR